MAMRSGCFSREYFYPFPLVGEGQDEGMHGSDLAGRPFTLSLCGALINQGPTGRGNLDLHGR
jgi:hypothetical protein